MRTFIYFSWSEKTTNASFYLRETLLKSLHALTPGIRRNEAHLRQLIALLYAKAYP